MNATEPPGKAEGISQQSVVYISWAESCSRSDHTARELGGKSFMVYITWLGSHPLTVPFKYLGQWCMTQWILIRERPSVIFVMSPPLFAALPAFLHGWLFRKPFVMDCHTAAYLHPRWQRLQWLQHWLGRRAATNIVTNDHLENLVREHGGKTTIVRDVPVVYESVEAFPLAESFSVAVVCTFNPDEPIAEIFEAARLLPDINFYVTGNTRFLDPTLAKQKPTNVSLTGFISNEAYGDLISRASVVMSLTTRDHTMLRGAWEAIYQGTPVIISDWPCLRTAFTSGAVFAQNHASEIARAISDARQNYQQLKAGAREAKEVRLEQWQQVRAELLSAVGLAFVSRDA